MSYAIKGYTSMVKFTSNKNIKSIYVNYEDKLKITYEEEFNVVGLSDCNGFRSENAK